MIFDKILPESPLQTYEKSPMLVYLHIPYCDSKCHYCAFNSYVGRFDTRPAYMKALHRQLAHELKRFGARAGSIETLFIGGGTPSTVAPDLYAPLFDLLRPYLAPDAEITAEANPNSTTRTWLEGMHDLGVGRISFGVQSFDPDKLKTLGRAHSPDQAKEAILTAHELGIPHLSLDLIYNVHGDTEALLASDITQAFDLPIDHLSAYELTIESHTPFAETPEVRQTNDQLAFFVAQEITQRGFTHYEISNFGRYQSRHNLGYWELKDYIGAGAGAVGYKSLSAQMEDGGWRMEDERSQDTAGIRYYPPTDINGYLRDPLAVMEEPLSAEDLRTERLFLGLRSRVGVEADGLSASMRDRADLLVREGKLTFEAGRYHNPDFFLADELSLFVLG